jgi:hypothetical protein
MRRFTAWRRPASTMSRHSSAGRATSAGARVKSRCQNVLSFRVPSGSITRTVAGGSLRTPFRIVRGAGTTAWNVM